MFDKLAKHRKFDYTPRYYSPEREEKERGRPRIQFKRLHHQRSKSRSLIWLIAMIGLIVYLLVVISKFAYN